MRGSAQLMSQCFFAVATVFSTLNITLSLGKSNCELGIPTTALTIQHVIVGFGLKECSFPPVGGVSFTNSINI